LRERFAQLGQSRLRVMLEAQQDIPSLSAAVETAVYRIAVEAVTNVVRHANVRECRVCLRVEDNLQLEISDDGKGFSPKYRAGVGLRAMQERAEELGGTFRIQRTSGKGTHLIIVLPLERT
jgi:two-component system NarL family sensor kinase